MKTCPQCSAGNLVTAKFCCECGQRLVAGPLRPTRPITENYSLPKGALPQAHGKIGAGNPIPDGSDDEDDVYLMEPQMMTDPRTASRSDSPNHPLAVDDSLADMSFFNSITQNLNNPGESRPRVRPSKSSHSARTSRMARATETSVSSQVQSQPQNLAESNSSSRATHNEMSATTSAESVQITNAAKESALVRFQTARDLALRKLIEGGESIPITIPRHLKRQISQLQSIPATDTDSLEKEIRLLGASGAPELLSTLSELCQGSSRRVREACMEAMGDIRHPGSAILLLKLLGDKLKTVSEAAVKSLAKLDYDVIRPVLIAAGLYRSSLRTIISAAVESASDDAKAEWEQFLLIAIQSRDVEAAAFALSLLVRITGDRHLDIYVQLASSSSPVQRAAAVEALARSESKRSISKINDAMLDPDAQVRAQAAMAVAVMHSPRSLELLPKLAFDSDVLVRRNAAQTMSRIDCSDLGAAIQQALEQESDATTVESLLAALQRNGGDQSLPVLQKYIEGDEVPYRELAVKALRKLKLAASIPLFCRLLDDRAAGLRRQSIEHLAALRADVALPQIRRMLKLDPDEGVRSACAKALGDLEDASSLHLLEQSLEDHPLVRLQAIIALGRLGQRSAGPSLTTLLRDPHPEVRYQAVRALGQLKLRGTEESIRALTVDPDEMVRRGATQALQDLGMTKSQIRSERLRRRIASLTTRLAPASLAGAIPGGSRSLIILILAITLAGSFWGFSTVNFLAAGGEQLPAGRVMSVGAGDSASTIGVLRVKGILDLWSVANRKLTARVKVPSHTDSILCEEKGGILLLMGNEIGRISAESDYSVDKMQILKLTQPNCSVSYHKNSNSLCIFEIAGQTTTLRIIDAATLAEIRSLSIDVAFTGTVSPDFSLAAKLDAGGTLSICDLTSGEVLKGSVEQITGQKDLGMISCVTFSDDMKYIAFCTSRSFVVMRVDNMQFEKQIPAPDRGGFLSAHSRPGTSDFVVLSTSGVVYDVSDNLKSVIESKVERSVPFNLSAVSPEGDLVAFANTEFDDFDVFSVKEQKIILTDLGDD